MRGLHYNSERVLLVLKLQFIDLLQRITLSSFMKAAALCTEYFTDLVFKSG